MTPNLSGLTIGSLALSPSFDKDVVEYTAGTTNAKDKVTASADASLTVTIEVNGTEIENESDATWTAGENTVEITVTNSASVSKVYTVTVTQAPEAKLSGITVGALTLTPTFDADVTEYAVTTSNNSNKVTASAAEGLEIALDLDGTEIENESSPTWEDGDNVLTITVSNEIGDSEEYVVTVTKE